MILNFKDPKKHDLKKVLIYGLDGSGKSTFASNYCKEHNLNPVVIDIDDTNRTALYTEGRVLNLPLKNSLQTFNNVRDAIDEIAKHDEYDTIILDGVTSLLEMLVSDAKGLAKYSDRSMRFQKIIQSLLASGKNLIFIGQIDMEVIFTDEFQSSKVVIKVNSLVNEKYLCELDDKGNFTHEVIKYRTIDKPNTNTNGNSNGSVNVDDTVKSICQKIKDQLDADGKVVSKSSMKSVVIKEIKAGNIDADLRPSLIKYIQKHCPEDLD